MNSEAWQQLLALETRDAITSWHQKLYDRTLNARRASEITSAAKQAREFFRSARQANNSVRALLSFYGIASLSRAALLLLKPGAGEESLVASHGLSTVDWRATLGGDISTGISALDTLQIETKPGLFTDFLGQTNNQICMHVNSSAVDWRISYDLPPAKSRVSLGELFARLPDLSSYLPPTTRSVCASVNSLECTEARGFKAKIISSQFEPFAEVFTGNGYIAVDEGTLTVLTANSETFSAHMPVFTHGFVRKTFGRIPSLHVAPPWDGGAQYSQLAMTYMLSYFLGMLTRYFPTQWNSLASGAKGDQIWPAVNAAQNYVETAFPEMLLELIQDRIAEKQANGA